MGTTTESVTREEVRPDEETETPAPPPVFTESRENNRPVWTVTRNRPNLRRCQKGQCPRPRKLILRKVRRKLFKNERERLEQRRRFLSSKQSQPEPDTKKDEEVTAYFS